MCHKKDTIVGCVKIKNKKNILLLCVCEHSVVCKHWTKHLALHVWNVCGFLKRCSSRKARVCDDCEGRQCFQYWTKNLYICCFLRHACCQHGRACRYLKPIGWTIKFERIIISDSCPLRSAVILSRLTSGSHLYWGAEVHRPTSVPECKTERVSQALNMFPEIDLNASRTEQWI